MNGTLRGMFVLAGTALLALGASAADDENIEGTWDVTLQTTADKSKPRLDLEQDGSDVTGKYTDEFGTAQISGEVNGKEVELSFTVDIPNDKNDLTVTYTGTVEGNTMRGKVKFDKLGEGAFVGTKR